MPYDESVALRIRHLLHEQDDVGERKMFGGLAIYIDGEIFSIVMPDGRILLKGQGEMQECFDAMGMKRWEYARPNGTLTKMPYWHMPESTLDNPDEAVDLARQALKHL